MFTGLIEEIGGVVRRSNTELTILAEKVVDGMSLGESVSVDGACLTAVSIEEDRFVVQMSPETVERTTLGRLRPGHAVNLERAMALGGRVGGHFVQGHVDGVGRIHSVTPQGDFAMWRFQAPEEVAKYLVPKGSICIDGISLTVVEPRGGDFAVAVIPATLENTTLPAKAPGDPVNMEADLIGKHIYHYLNRTQESGGLNLEFLSRHGFA